MDDIHHWFGEGQKFCLEGNGLLKRLKSPGVSSMVACSWSESDLFPPGILPGMERWGRNG
jgi:hypothetical protein